MIGEHHERTWATETAPSEPVSSAGTRIRNESEAGVPAAFSGRGQAEGQGGAHYSGGDSGIGRAVAVHMAREGADIAIVYLEEDDDAIETAKFVEAEGRRCLTISGDVSKEDVCKKAVSKIIEEFGHLNILINNAAEQHEKGGDGPLDITQEQLQRTFQTNIFGYFYMTKAALEHLKEGAAIVNTTSVTAYKGNVELIDLFCH